MFEIHNCYYCSVDAHANIATLGSILESQQRRESGKFQLARWSHEAVIFPERTTHPPDHMDFQL